MRGHKRRDAPRVRPGASRADGEGYSPYNNLIITGNTLPVKKTNLARQVAIHTIYRLETWLYYAWRAVNERLIAMLGSPR